MIQLMHYMDDAQSKARTLGITSLVFGLIAPGLLVIAFLLFFVLATSIGGFGALGLAAVFELSVPVFSFFIAIPLGIVAIIFAIKALSTIGSLQALKGPYLFPLCLGILNIIFPILLAVWLIPPGACIYHRNPGTGGCLALPIIPLSWQVGPQYLQQLKDEESGTPQTTTTYPTPAPSKTYINETYGFSFTYPPAFSLSTESSTNSGLKNITLQEISASGASVTLFINQPYPTDTKNALGISTVGFNASGSLWESNYSGPSEYSPSGTYNAFLSGYDLTSQFTDSRGNSYYWKNAFANSEQDRDEGLIIFSMKTL